MALDRFTGQAHRIDRVRFEISAAREGDLMALRQKLEHAGQNALQEALRRPFDAIAGRDSVLQIEQLEIDLGPIVPDADLDLDNLAQAVVDKLTRALKTQVKTPSFEDNADPDDETNLHWEDVRTLGIEAFVFYLQHGFLPATAPERDISALVTAVIGKGESIKDHVVRIVVVLRSQPVLVKRFFHVMGRPEILVFLQAFARTFSKTKNARILALRKDVETSGSKPDTSQWTQSFQDILKTLVPAALDDDTVFATNETSITVVPDGHSDQRNKTKDEATPEAAKRADLLPLPDAGLVLIGPYLPRLFDRLALKPSGENAATAARLLFWLAHGHEDFLEPDLLIARVLLAVSPEIPLVSETPLDPDMTSEACGLLDAVIGHWDRLGNTSHDALRETFLQRSGLLERRARGARIAVEARGVDVLLGGLSWSYAFLKFPWSTQPIEVDWA